MRKEDIKSNVLILSEEEHLEKHPEIRHSKNYFKTCEEYVINELEELKEQNDTLKVTNEKLMDVAEKFDRVLELIQKYASCEGEKVFVSIYGWKTDKVESADYELFMELCGLEEKENKDHDNGRKEQKAGRSTEG